MPKQAIESEAIEAVDYDPRSEILRVTFHNGRSYEYLGVPPEEFRNFMNAESRGTYMNQVIKRRYKWRKV